MLPLSEIDCKMVGQVFNMKVNPSYTLSSTLTYTFTLSTHMLTFSLIVLENLQKWFQQILQLVHVATKWANLHRFSKFNLQEVDNIVLILILMSSLSTLVLIYMKIATKSTEADALLLISLKDRPPPAGRLLKEQ